MTPELKLDYMDFCDMALGLYRRLVPLRDEYRGILCPLRGGFYLSDFLSRRLGLGVEYMHLSSYEGHRSGEFQIRFSPRLEVGERYLICDDILATGRTIQKIEELFPGVLFDAVFLYRHRNRALPFPRTLFSREVDESVWIVFPWEDESVFF